jgi:hypothetical protein
MMNRDRYANEPIRVEATWWYCPRCLEPYASRELAARCGCDRAPLVRLGPGGDYLRDLYGDDL